MIVVRRWSLVGVASALAVFSTTAALVWAAMGRSPATTLLALGCFALAFLLCLPRAAEASGPVTLVVLAAGVALTLLGTVGLDPARDAFSSGGWYVCGVACIVVVLRWRQRRGAGWVLLGALVAHTFLWGGLPALDEFGVIAAVLLIAIMAAGGWAVERTEEDLGRFSAAERQALEWAAAQDAYQSERQARLATTARLATGMLQRIAGAEDGLTDADRFECRVLEQTIRDEIRGRRLLNDGVREQVIAHRRRGALVQVNDDGGLDDVDLAAMEPLLDRVAAALTGLTSDRIIIRTAPRDSERALSVVAMSADPVASALGVDDGGDDQVDLWLELDRPPLLGSERASALRAVSLRRP